MMPITSAARSIRPCDVVNRSPTFRTGIAPPAWRVRDFGRPARRATSPFLPHANESIVRVPSSSIQQRLFGKYLGETRWLGPISLILLAYPTGFEPVLPP